MVSCFKTQNLIIFFWQILVMKTNFVSVNKRGFLSANNSIQSDRSNFYRPKSFLLTKVVSCQHRIKFCLTEFISVDKSHFCPQKWFFEDSIHFFLTKFWSFLSTKVISVRKSDFFSGQNSFLSDKVHFCPRGYFCKNRIKQCQTGMWMLYRCYKYI